MKNTQNILLTCAMIAISIAVFYATSEMNNDSLHNYSLNQQVAFGNRIENSSSQYAARGSFSGNGLDDKSIVLANQQSEQPNYEMPKTEVPNAMLSQMNTGNSEVGYTKRTAAKNVYSADVNSKNTSYSPNNYQVDNQSKTIIKNLNAINIITDNKINAIIQNKNSANSIMPKDNNTVNFLSNSNSPITNSAASTNVSSTALASQPHGFLSMTTDMPTSDLNPTSTAGPQKSGDPGGGPPGDPIPVGDGVWCMLLMAAAWGMKKMK